MPDVSSSSPADDSHTPGALTRRSVTSEGLQLAAWEGEDNGPPVLFVHGFPDTHALWLPVIERLGDNFHCIAYDVRGAGSSDPASEPRGYAISHLVTDLIGVINDFVPERSVHVVGHDWGSIQAWEAILSESSDKRLTGRIASFTSISGPSADAVGLFFATSVRGGWSRRREALKQAGRWWYVFAFQLPVVPDLVLPWLIRRLVRPGNGGGGHFTDTLPRDAANGVNLYRANLGRGAQRPSARRTSLPVQLVVALQDRYITPALAGMAETLASNLTRVELDAGHWLPHSHADELASCLATFIDSIEAAD